MATQVTQEAPADIIERDRALTEIQDKVLWLAMQMVYHANEVRPSPDEGKVGGHQASSSSIVTLMTSLFFDFMNAGDRISVKPHASPVFHAIQYLLGNLDREHLTQLRAFHGLQAYPSRTKDPDPVDFSTGSVGLGAVAPNFAALTHEYAQTRMHVVDLHKVRYISVVGDAELDEGSVWEAIAEPAMHDLSHVLWVVDLNRQSLDRVIPAYVCAPGGTCSRPTAGTWWTPSTAAGWSRRTRSRTASCCACASTRCPTSFTSGCCGCRRGRCASGFPSRAATPRI